MGGNIHPCDYIKLLLMCSGDGSTSALVLLHFQISKQHLFIYVQHKSHLYTYIAKQAKKARYVLKQSHEECTLLVFKLKEVWVARTSQ